MNLFSKQFQRGITFTSLVALLLAVAVAFCSIGFAAWRTAKDQLSKVDSQYTTVAVPIGSDDYSWWGVFHTEEGSMPLTQQLDKKYPGLLTEDIRGFLAAHVSGCASISPYDSDDLGNNLFNAYNNSMMVLAVKCSSVIDLTSPEPMEQAIFDENGNVTGYEEIFERSYMADFTLEEPVCRLPAYDIIPENMNISLFSKLYTADGQLPFEEGKTYLLFGFDNGFGSLVENFDPSDSSFSWTFDDNTINFFVADETFGFGSNSGDMSTGNMLFSWREQKNADGAVYRILTDDSLPFCAEYSGDWRDFLQSDDGAIWRDEIIPLCQINHESAGVILTDNVDSLLLFNDGSASLLDGRKFDPSEYAQGNAVCLVSAAYAAKNGLSVGDQINLDLYQSDLNYRMYLTTEMSQNFTPVWVQDPCTPNNRIGVQKDYTIVGIYTAPEFAPGWHSFQADTIFIPKASVPNGADYEDHLNPLLYSVVLENGKAEEFEAYISDMGNGGVFAYFDQEYNVLYDSLAVISANALRLCLTGCGAFLLAAALFLFLNFRRSAPVSRNMRLLGINAKAVWKEWMLALSVLIVIASAVGAGLGCALYGVITSWALNNGIALQPQIILLSAVAQAVILIVAAGAFSVPMTTKRLIESRKNRKP